MANQRSIMCLVFFEPSGCDFGNVEHTLDSCARWLAIQPTQLAAGSCKEFGGSFKARFGGVVCHKTQLSVQMWVAERCLSVFEPLFYEYLLTTSPTRCEVCVSFCAAHSNLTTKEGLPGNQLQITVPHPPSC